MKQTCVTPATLVPDAWILPHFHLVLAPGSWVFSEIEESELGGWSMAVPVEEAIAALSTFSLEVTASSFFHPFSYLLRMNCWMRWILTLMMRRMSNPRFRGRLSGFHLKLVQPLAPLVCKWSHIFLTFLWVNSCNFPTLCCLEQRRCWKLDKLVGSRNGKTEWCRTIFVIEVIWLCASFKWQFIIIGSGLYWVGISFAEYSDVSAYRLSLSEDTKALNQLVSCWHSPARSNNILLLRAFTPIL